MSERPGRGRPRTHGHGTEARYRKHHRDGDKPCQACLEAAAYARNWRRRQHRYETAAGGRA